HYGYSFYYCSFILQCAVFKKFKKLTAVALSATLMVSAVSMSASAISLDSVYDAPSAKAADVSTDVSDVSANYACLSGSTAAANTTLLSILGINVTSTDAAGVYNSAGTNGQSTPINLQIFGSDWNSSPDPYYYTFYYNFANNTITPNGTTVGDCTDSSVYSGWTGDYTLIYSGNKSGPSGAVTTLLDSLTVNSVTKYSVNPAFFYNPDLLFSRETVSGTSALISSSTAYTSTDIATYNTANSSSYSPVVIGGWNTSQYCINSGTDFSNIESMAEGIQTIASTIENNTDKSGRYGDLTDIAERLYAFSVTLHNNMAAKTAYTTAVYCVAPTYNDDGTVTVAAASGRYAQYLDGLGTDLFDEAGLTTSTNTMSLSAFIKLAEDYGAVAFVDCDAEDFRSDLDDAEFDYVVMPDTVYGMTMQSADNLLGPAYVFAALYGGSDSSLPSCYDVLAYWVTYFYHVNDEYLEDAMSLMLNETVTASMYHSTTFTTLVNNISGYTES
ncbi:MAG: hypothetical protein LUE91_03750, partial [Oscillospiraceae bacterium]|nr:hypothetical protein [Oscillospiraceae bacterium]